MKTTNPPTNTLLIITCLATAALAFGCKQSAESSTATTSEQLDKVKAETKEAAKEMKDYAYNQRSEFVTAMQGQLDEINKNLDELGAKVEKATDSVKAEAKPKIQALREKADLLVKQLGQVKSADESTWESIKTGSKKAFGDLKDGFNQARQWVSDKIAP